MYIKDKETRIETLKQFIEYCNTNEETRKLALAYLNSELELEK